ncbi:hypothetical protein [Flavobacterium sp.]|uniref:CBU_0592 family membrane protein n=1 Tax=Flavobacterium sp. TaxID=239 RepID=UPI00374D17D0
MNYNDLIGSLGVSIVLVAYFLNIYSLIKKDGLLFYSLNILGATIACYASVLINYMPFIILEGTWAIVSIFGLLKSLKKE